MSHIFISHSTKDGADLARQLVAVLEAAGSRCWVAPRDVTVGPTYPGQIVSAIRASRGLVLLLTPVANQSQDVLQEVTLAHNERKIIAVLTVGATQPSDDLSYFLGARHRTAWIDAKASAVALGKVFAAEGEPAAQPSKGSDAAQERRADTQQQQQQAEARRPAAQARGAAATPQAGRPTQRGSARQAALRAAGFALLSSIPVEKAVQICTGLDHYGVAGPTIGTAVTVAAVASISAAIRKDGYKDIPATVWRAALGVLLGSVLGAFIRSAAGIPYYDLFVTGSPAVVAVGVVLGTRGVTAAAAFAATLAGALLADVVDKFVRLEHAEVLTVVWLLAGNPLLAAAATSVIWSWGSSWLRAPTEQAQAAPNRP
jgi:hypothetical protein